MPATNVIAICGLVVFLGYELVLRGGDTQTATWSGDDADRGSTRLILGTYVAVIAVNIAFGGASTLWLDLVQVWNAIDHGNPSFAQTSHGEKRRNDHQAGKKNRLPHAEHPQPVQQTVRKRRHLQLDREIGPKAERWPERNQPAQRCDDAHHRRRSHRTAEI